MKDITQASHCEVTGFNSVFSSKKNKSNNGTQKGTTDTLGKRVSSGSQEVEGDGKKHKAMEYSDDQISKQLKTSNIIVPSLTNNKALSVAGFETQVMDRATNFIIKQANFKFINKFRKNGKTLMSPPNEPFKISGQEKAFPQSLREVEEDSNFKISDEMIKKYQKFDIMLTYMASNKNRDFFASTWMRAFLESYFLKYQALLTPKFHKISKKNMDFIMSSIDLFTDQENRFMGKQGEFSCIQEPEINHQQSESTLEMGLPSCDLSILKSSGSRSRYNGSHIFSFQQSQISSLKSFKISNKLPNSTEKEIPLAQKSTQPSTSQQFNPAPSNSKFRAPEKKTWSIEEILKIEKSIDAKISLLRDKFLYIIVGLIKYTYFHLDLTDKGQLLKELIERRQLGQEHMYLHKTQDKIMKYHKQMCGILKEISTIEELIERIKNIEDLGIEQTKIKIDPQSPDDYEMPSESFKVAILLDFGKELILGMNTSFLSVSKELKQCFEIMGYKLGSMSDKYSFNSQNLSFMGELNFSTVDEFKAAVSSAGSNPLAKIYGIFN